MFRISAASFIVLVLATGSAYASSPCPLSTTNPSVTVCTPTPNALVQSQVNVVAGSTDSHTVTTMQIYVDNKLTYQVKASSVNTFVTMPAGYHLITVQGWDNTGATFKTNVPVAMQPPCALNTTNQTVTICSLVSGSIVSQPFHVVAAATDSNSIKSMTLFIDGVGKNGISNSAIYDVYVNNVSLGTHSIAVQAQDSTGALFKQKFNITVTAASNGLSNLKHIIFFLQENRSFDSYFGMLGPYKASEGLVNDVDGLNLNTTLKNTQGQPVHPFHYQTVCTDDLSPAWNEAHQDVDGGLMDDFMYTTQSVPSSIDPTGTRAMGYYDQTDLPYYYEAAARFATSDRWFSPDLANTIPNRLYLFTATSFGNAFPPNTSFESITQPTIFDHLDQAGVSWRYYYQGSASSAFIQQFATYKNDASKVVPIANWYNDIQNDSTLPSVIFIERLSSTDEHPNANVQTGAAFASGVINALIGSPSWGDSALIFTYDEGGGLYDHVLPARMVPPDSIPPQVSSTDKQGAFNQTGFRLPLIVFSPWARPSFVSHTTRDYMSILKLIEDRFNVAPLTLRDANADDMMEFFNFSGAPPLLTPPTLPAQPTNGVCDHNKEKAPGF
ncbi:MAG TPA: alkaline phosphatase family protein [Terriglobales bacterium]|nr:alkaline phosphatase family protein [Terriglobales bacterium]